MGRILAIDYGRKRVGIAVTDPGQMIASPLITVGAHEIFEFLLKYFEKEGIEEIVLGYPRNLNNEDSESLLYVKQFETAFRRKYPGITVHLVDERFTSSLAMDALVRGGMKKKDRQIKNNLDKVSAAIILQSFLENRQTVNKRKQ